MGKFAACNAAIDGILMELDKTRLVWTQLLEILHDKSLQGVPPVECFRALKRSRVASVGGVLSLVNGAVFLTTGVCLYFLHIDQNNRGRLDAPITYTLRCARERICLVSSNE